MGDPRTGAQCVIHRASAAEASKLDSLFLGDHHATPTPYYQNIPTMGRLLGNWSGSTCGILVLLPLWHPVLVAEMLSTLASISSSRFVLRAGIGFGKNQFSALSADYKRRGDLSKHSISCKRIGPERLLPIHYGSSSGPQSVQHRLNRFPSGQVPLHRLL